jgi:Lipocalin-like domain
MTRRSFIQTSVITALGLAISLSSAMAQTKSLKDQLVGSWTLVSAEPYGTNPTGSYMFDSNGRFSAILMRRDLPKYASNSRTQATAAEYKGTVDGSIAYFGTYSVSGNDLDLHIEGSTFPNWAGTVQKRTNVSVAGDELKYNVPAPSDGRPTAAPTVWKRVK